MQNLSELFQEILSSTPKHILKEYRKYSEEHFLNDVINNNPELEEFSEEEILTLIRNFRNS